MTGKNEVLEYRAQSRRRTCEKLYEFDLMQEGGHIAGWLVDGEVKEQFLEKLQSYEEQMTEKYKDLSDDPITWSMQSETETILSGNSKSLLREVKEKSSMGTYQRSSSEICIGRTREST